MMNYRAQRRYYRAQRQAYRRQRRGYSGGFGGLIWLIVIASLTMMHLWQLSLLAFFGLPFFFLVLRPILFNTTHARNQQQYGQPQQEPPLSQPYTRGYGAQHPPTQQSEIYQEGEQLDRYPAQQTQHYEEPRAIYPQE